MINSHHLPSFPYLVIIHQNKFLSTSYAKIHNNHNAMIYDEFRPNFFTLTVQKVDQARKTSVAAEISNFTMEIEHVQGID